MLAEERLLEAPEEQQVREVCLLIAKNVMNPAVIEKERLQLCFVVNT